MVNPSIGARVGLLQAQGPPGDESLGEEDIEVSMDDSLGCSWAVVLGRSVYRQALH